MTPLDLIDRIAGLRILVVGEAMLDSYLHGHVARLCREAPVPIVALDGCDDTLGGAANTAAGVRALGAEVAFLSVVGADDAGARIEAALRDQGIETLLFKAPGRTTMVKQRVSGNHQLLVRLDRGSEDDVMPCTNAACWTSSPPAGTAPMRSSCRTMATATSPRRWSTPSPRTSAVHRASSPSMPRT